MLIAICDDEPLFCKMLKEKIYSYSNKNNLNYYVDVFYDGHSLLNKSREYDIVFLDYQMPDISGLETANEMRKKNMLSMIVFISSYPEVVFKTFQYDTFRFLIKPLRDDDLYEALDAFRKKKGLYYPILIHSEREHIKINTGDIVYIEANGRNCIVRTIKNSIPCSKSINCVYSALPSNCFFFTHRSFIVNFNSILSFNKSSIKFINGEVAKISRDRYQKFLNALDAYHSYISS